MEIDKFSDEYAFLLDSLPAALQNSYDEMKELSFSRTDLDYSKIIVDRLRAFYCTQEQVKNFLISELGKQELISL